MLDNGNQNKPVVLLVLSIGIRQHKNAVNQNYVGVLLDIIRYEYICDKRTVASALGLYGQLINAYTHVHIVERKCAQYISTFAHMHDMQTEIQIRSVWLGTIYSKLVRMHTEIPITARSECTG